jgi:hypothetical protein
MNGEEGGGAKTWILAAGPRQGEEETSLYFSTLLTHEKLIDIYFFFDCDFNEE